MENQVPSIHINLFSADKLLEILLSLPSSNLNSASDWNTRASGILNAALLPLLEDYLDPKISTSSCRAFSELQDPKLYSYDDLLGGYFVKISATFPSFFKTLPFPDPADEYSFSTVPIHFLPTDETQQMSYETYMRRQKLGLFPKNLFSRKGQKTLLSASQLFFLCDAPLLSHLCISKIEQSTLEDSFVEIGSTLDLYIQNKCRRGHLPDAFGIQIQKQKKPPTEKGCRAKTEYTLLTPSFCSSGRLLAFLRFTAGSKHVKKYSGTIVYHIRSLQNGFDQDILKDTLSDDDAWFYEMCTGLSLTAEISSLILELETAPGIPTNWNQHRRSVFLNILEHHREHIVSCPAVTWRFTVIRNIFRQINTYFTSPNTSATDLFPPSSIGGFEYYFNLANEYFEYLLGLEICQIDQAFPSSFIKAEQETYSHGFINAAFRRFNQDNYFSMDLISFHNIGLVSIENATQLVQSCFPACSLTRLSREAPTLFSSLRKLYRDSKNDLACLKKYYTSITSETIYDILIKWSISFIKAQDIDIKAQDTGIKAQDTDSLSKNFKESLSNELFTFLTKTYCIISEENEPELQKLCFDVADYIYNTCLNIRSSRLPFSSPNDSLHFIKCISECLLSHLKKKQQQFFCQESSNYFRFCNCNHKNIEKYLYRERNDNPLPYNSDPAPQSELEHIFQSVHDVLYPGGYIEITL